MHNLSRALNLHHSGSDLHAVFKGSASGFQVASMGLPSVLQVVFNSNLRTMNLEQYSRSLNYFVLLFICTVHAQP